MTRPTPTPAPAPTPTPAPTPAPRGLRVQNLCVRFGGVTSLDDVTLELPSGTCGLIGPNGAGKTTFFNVVSGFVTPLAGRVLVDGEDISAMPTHRRARWGVRRTFQTEQAIASLSVFDNVLTVYEHSGGPRNASRDAVMTALEIAQLDGLADRPVGTLGAGERRFVEIARAVVGTPRLILLDEPAAGLPDEETARLAAAIVSLPARVSATVVLVDHDMSLVQTCCSVIAVLDFGRLIACGATAEVLREPAVRAAYLGDVE